MGSADGKWPRITLVERVCAVANQFRGDKEEVWTPIGGQDVLPLAIRSKVSHKDQDKVEEVRKKKKILRSSLASLRVDLSSFKPNYIYIYILHIE
jgi:hypothetical protein